MRYILLACLLGLALAFDLGVLLATSDDVFSTFDPHHPATILPIIAGRLHDLESRARAAVSEFIDAAIAPYRAQILHQIPAHSEPQEL